MWKVQLFKLNFDGQEQEAVKEVLDSAWITWDKKLLILNLSLQNILEKV